MISTRRSLFSLCLLVVAALMNPGAEAFVNPSPVGTTRISNNQHQQVSSVTALQERKWNFNEGQAPWGLKKNAEIWNGRVAQVRDTGWLL